MSAEVTSSTASEGAGGPAAASFVFQVIHHLSQLPSSDPLSLAPEMSMMTINGKPTTRVDAHQAPFAIPSSLMTRMELPPLYGEPVSEEVDIGLLVK